MAPRAENPNSLSGPTGPSLLDQSNATPADINPEIFKSRNPERQPTEGTVSSDYLKRTREEDPWPAESSCAPKTNAPPKSATVTLSDCRIDTPTEDLATDQPFQMSCQATTSDGSPLKGDIRFKLYCTLPDGTEEFTNHTVIGKRKGDRYCAEGTLFSPKEPVEWGAPLKYYVTAEHPGAGEKAKSGVAEVVGYMPPKPLAVWKLGVGNFEKGTSLLLPTAKEPFTWLRKFIDDNPNVRLVIEACGEKTLARSCAFAVYCTLVCAADLYEINLLQHEGGRAEWIDYCALVMFDFCIRLGCEFDELSILTGAYLMALFGSPLDPGRIIGSHINDTPQCSVCRLRHNMCRSYVPNGKLGANLSGEGEVAENSNEDQGAQPTVYVLIYRQYTQDWSSCGLKIIKSITKNHETAGDGFLVID